MTNQLHLIELLVDLVHLFQIGKQLAYDSAVRQCEKLRVLYRIPRYIKHSKDHPKLNRVNNSGENREGGKRRWFRGEIILTTRSTLAKITSPDLGAAGAMKERERRSWSDCYWFSSRAQIFEAIVNWFSFWMETSYLCILQNVNSFMLLLLLNSFGYFFLFCQFI